MDDSFQDSQKKENEGELRKFEEINDEKCNDIPNFKDIKSFLTSTDHFLPSIYSHKISLAPMIDITDVHFRNLMRLLTRYAVLYTEMIHEQAVHHNVKGPEEFLRFDPVQHPIVIQLGGNNPENLASAAKICENLGYDEINFNVGCPSDRVQTGKFGACLMKEPKLVANIMKKMKEACSTPCTIKCRLGVDDLDSYEFAHDFVKEVSENGGVDHFIIHARKAFLKGLNPAQNRNIPPLKYDYVFRLQKDFSHIKFSINGGFKTYDQVDKILEPEKGLVGCMIGRNAYETPWFFSDLDRRYYGKPNPGFSRREILQIWGKYGKFVLESYPQTSFPTLNKPIINLFAGEKSSVRYRHFLSERVNFLKFKDYEQFILEAIKEFEFFNQATLDIRPAGCINNDESLSKVILDSIKNNFSNSEKYDPSD